MIVYLQCDKDKYRLPNYYTESIEDLAKHSGKTVNQIKDLIQKAEKRGGESQFIKIEISEDDEDD